MAKFIQLEKKFTRPLVATVVTNFKSVQVLSHWSNFNMYKASRQCAPSCEFAMHQRKCNCNVCSCVAFLLYASSSCAFLEYLITCFLMLRYACIADNGLEFPQCVSKCAFSHQHLDWLSSCNVYISVVSPQCELGSGSSNIYFD